MNVRFVTRHMREITIAFDIDNCLIKQVGYIEAVARGVETLNYPVFSLIHILFHYTKNVRIIAWSGGGKEHAEEIVERYNLRRYVSACYDKQHCPIVPDICFDDMDDVNMANYNIIVK